MERIPKTLALATTALVLFGGMLMWHAESQTNQTVLANAPRPVSVVATKEAPFRATRVYVGTLSPWVQANIGPQFVSAYIDTVLVRPGVRVARKQVLATLDCRNANATSQAVAMQARAVQAREHALSDQAARMQNMLKGNFVSVDEAEQKSADSAVQSAQLAAAEASLQRSSLEVDDCILRAPFDGEVTTRNADPGAFVRPGTTIVQVVDRSTVRFVADVPEDDFDVVVPGTKVRIHAMATRTDLTGIIARRSAAADDDTRTVRFEVDLPDTEHKVPVGTTGEVFIDVGEPLAATQIPSYAATVRGAKATLFVVGDGIAHQRSLPVLGEKSGVLYFARDALGDARVVSEGRALLKDGDRVAAKEEVIAKTP
jgi:RND family efflux transporter MFP subunit